MDFSVAPTHACKFKSLEAGGYADTVKTLVDPVTEGCEYDPVAGTSWHYGCSLGITLDMLQAVGSSGFRVWPFPPISCPATLDLLAPATYCPSRAVIGSRPPGHHRPLRPR